MKNNKGITLSSLVVYIAVVIIVVAIIMRITTYFINNMSDSADIRFETEFNKINLYLLDESKTTGNRITEMSGTQVTFSNGNKYTFNEEDKVIYLNDSIKICENVTKASFGKKIAENGREVLIVKIVIGKTAKTTEYVMPKAEQGIVISEEDYITSRLPAEYQQVEYLQSAGKQYVDTGYAANSNSNIICDFEYLSGESNKYIPIFGQRVVNGKNMFVIWIHSSTGKIALNYGTVDTSSIANTNGFGRHIYANDGNKFYLDGILINEISCSNFSSTASLVVFASRNAANSAETRGIQGRLYSFKIYDSNVLVRDFIPCYRKSDNVAGLYDIANDIFYTNKGTGNFTVGGAVN